MRLVRLTLTRWPSSSAIGRTGRPPNERCHARTWLWISRPGFDQSMARSRRLRSTRPRTRPRSAADRRDRRPRAARGPAGAARSRPRAAWRRCPRCRVVVLDRHRRLGEDRPRVELGIHAVPGHAQLAVALADRPGERDRPAVARQRRRVLVDDAEARHVERLLRDLPRKPQQSTTSGSRRAGAARSHACRGRRAG